MRTFNQKIQTSRRKLLRNNPTQAEKVLWGALRDSQLDGIKFRRQCGIGNYIVDFYCPSERLAIEVDGCTHIGDESLKKDAIRDNTLEEYGVTVIRFSNEDVIKNLYGVTEEIKKHFRRK